MDILRTPDSQFENLPGFPWPAHYTEIDAGDGTPLRIARVDEGPRDAAPVLLMHGNPSWSYLYRKMIPGLLAAGHRVIAVDLVGCGRSDKPAAKDDYTLARHYQWMTDWLAAMDLKDITLFCQDWGGTIGLYLVAQHPERFARVIAANTGLPLGEGESDFMRMWVGLMKEATAFPWDRFGPARAHAMSEAEAAAYQAPFPDSRYEAGIVQFPVLIAVQPDNPGAPLNRAAWPKLCAYDRPFLTLWGGQDPVARGGNKKLQAAVAGAAGQPHHVFETAGHFVQEDVPEELVAHVNAFIASTK
ncbi:MAG: alpha/beta fold hydrolase [Caulobacteraceae bacterium]|nr:alpha/beta fold hydrolase [Caulobacteraceae bacterium]